MREGGGFMPLRLDTRSPDFGASFDALLKMKREVAEDVDQVVQAIIADVVAHGDAALVGYSRKFDRVDLEKLGLRVGGADIDAAFARCSPDALAALHLAHARRVTRRVARRTYRRGYYGGAHYRGYYGGYGLR
jgi:histidinol dehydrogenase